MEGLLLIADAIAGLSAFNSMLEMARGLKDVNDAAIRNLAVVELTEKIIAAQAAQTALIAEVAKLEKELTRFETWETEKQRYELSDVGNGQLVYTLRDGQQHSEPKHSICPSCYQRGQRSILQKETWQPGRAQVFSCHRCGSAVYLSGMPAPEHAKYRRLST
jgi:hypothetical protein